MQEATISNQSKQPEQQMYQRGKYPSVVDTDDLVFEMGIQLVGNLNKEKLLDSLVKKVNLLEKTAIEAVQAKVEVEKKIVSLAESNKLYIENNKNLDVALVKVRKEFDIAKASHVSAVAQCEEELAMLRDVHKKELADRLAVKEEEIAALKKRKSPKKKGS